MAAHTVLVTGVGGNVGQGILRALRDSPLDLRLVGTNTEVVTGGNHLCAALHGVPWSWEDGYLDRMVEVCDQELVDLVIPATDAEAFHLATGRDRVPPVAISSAETCLDFLDKHRTAKRFESAGIPFARSSLPSAYDGRFASTVVKPREGRGSRDVYVDPPDPARFPDSFVVQERAVGREMTVAGYVTRSGDLHAFVALERWLRQGTTMTCTVVHDVDDSVRQLLDTISGAIELAGSFNVQLIATDAGKLVPFEVNGRLSGTASIRHRLGFPDARWTVEEWLFDRKPDPPAVLDGSAVRLLMDVIYPASRLADIAAGVQPFEVF